MCDRINLVTSTTTRKEVRIMYAIVLMATLAMLEVADIAHAVLVGDSIELALAVALAVVFHAVLALHRNA
jgi:hypothetical protein